MFLLGNGYVLAELIPSFHHYHLDDAPELTSAGLIARRRGHEGVKRVSEPIAEEDLENFYGRHAPLEVRYVEDLRKGGALPSYDHRLHRFDQEVT